MKNLALIGTAAVALALGVVKPVCAQQQDEKPAQGQQEERRQEEPKPVPQEHPQQKQEEHRTQQEQKQPEHQAQQEQKQDEKQAQQEQKKDEQQRQEQKRDDKREVRDDHNTQPARGQRIPEDRFRAHFGREHHFRIERPVIVEGRPRFQYGGYSFIIIDTWPAGWYYTDDVYVDYVDGEYFLFNPIHPGIRIALNVVF